MAEKQRKRVRVHVHGIVQGVFYRATTRDKARRLGLVGWVRNVPRDGGVELVAEGDPDAVQKLVEWCHEGPPHAEVARVETSEEASAEEFDDFSIRY